MNIGIFAHGEHEGATNTVQTIMSGNSDIAPIVMIVIAIGLAGLMIFIRRINR